MILKGANLVKAYGSKNVVKGVSIQVERGEIVGLLGPNGAGKTTTFYMIVGLVKPTQGSVFLNQKDITSKAMYKRAQEGIGYLPQEASIFRKLSVEDNIMGVLQFTQLSKKEQKIKCDELIDEFGLEHVRKNRGDLLSGGERRRTEIARCLAVSPSFILLDEPFAGVDPIAVEDIQKIVRSLINKNIGILITDHNVQQTLAITHRTYIMFEGKILREGAPEDLANDPMVREKYLGVNFIYQSLDGTPPSIHYTYHYIYFVESGTVEEIQEQAFQYKLNNWELKDSQFSIYPIQNGEPEVSNNSSIQKLVKDPQYQDIVSAFPSQGYIIDYEIQSSVILKYETLPNPMPANWKWAAFMEEEQIYNLK